MPVLGHIFGFSHTKLQRSRMLRTCDEKNNTGNIGKQAKEATKRKLGRPWLIRNVRIIPTRIENVLQARANSSRDTGYNRAMFRQKNAKEKLHTTLGPRYAIEFYASLPGADFRVLDTASPIGSSQEPASNIHIRRCVISGFYDI